MPRKGLLRVHLFIASGPFLRRAQAEREGDLKTVQSSSLWLLSPWSVAELVQQTLHRMDGPVPRDLLTQQGQLCVLNGHCPSAVGWQPAGLASHVNSQASVSPFVKKKMGCHEVSKPLNPMCVIILPMPWVHTVLWRELQDGQKVSSYGACHPGSCCVGEGMIPTLRSWK